MVPIGLIGKLRKRLSYDYFFAALLARLFGSYTHTIKVVQIALRKIPFENPLLLAPFSCIWLWCLFSPFRSIQKWIQNSNVQVG